MKLNDILSGIWIVSLHGDPGAEIADITFDSRTVGKGSLFVAVEGVHADGHDFIPKAVEAGAAAVLCRVLPQELAPGVTYAQTENTDRALAEAAARFYGQPSRKLKLVGVTGTNGKTSIATLLYRLFRNLGHKAGLISTITYVVDDREIPSTHTTPDALRLNRMLAEMAEAGCEYCFMEVSSHSIVQGRIWGLHFAGGIFTNITHDHLDYHKTFANYIKAKQGFFDMLPASAFALFNKDDRNGEVMVQHTKAKKYSYALRAFADFKCRILESHFEGTELEMDGSEVWVRFIGRFNAYNLTAIYGAARLLGVEKETVLRELSTLGSVAGRFEYLIAPNGVVAVVDYAHTPDALENVIDTINQIKRPEQKLYCVVGCGGDRDRTKRPEMAVIAAGKADFAVFTSDNPRTEDPAAILREVVAGVEGKPEYMGRYVTVPDRAEAIRTAVVLASRGDRDIVLVAGKGHETYQEVCGVRHHFDDKEQLTQIFNTL